MRTIKAKFDGRVFVPSEDPGLPDGAEAEVTLSGHDERDLDDQDLIVAGSPDDAPSLPPDHPLAAAAGGASEVDAEEGLRRFELFLNFVDTFGDDASLPPDAAAEHDHYLYGTPKRGES